MTFETVKKFLELDNIRASLCVVIGGINIQQHRCPHATSWIFKVLNNSSKICRSISVSKSIEFGPFFLVYSSIRFNNVWNCVCMLEMEHDKSEVNSSDI